MARPHSRLMRRGTPRASRCTSCSAAASKGTGPDPPATASRWVMYCAVSSADKASRWKRAITRWASCSSSGRASMPRSSGWPIRMICSSLRSLVSRLVSRRSCSSTSALSSCASSMINTQLRPSAWACSKKELSRPVQCLTLSPCCAVWAGTMPNSSHTDCTSSVALSLGLTM